MGRQIIVTSARCSKEQVRQGWGMGWYTLLRVLLGMVHTGGPQISTRFRALEFMPGPFKMAYTGRSRS